MQTFPLKLMNSENSTDIKPQNNNNEYIPGQCNIGSKEIERRKRKAILGLAISLLGIALLQYFNSPSAWRFILFLPLFYSIICYYQAQQKFCVVFGIFGIYNFDNIGKTKRVNESNDKKKDSWYAWLIIFKSILFALLIVVIYYFLPL